MVRILIREGQHPNEQTQTLRNTPLHIAAKHGHLLVVKYLIENGGSVHLANAHGQSSYEMAEESADQVNAMTLSPKKNHLAKGIEPDQAVQILNNLEQIKMTISRQPAQQNPDDFEEE